MTSQLSIDSQLLQLSHDDLAFKKELLSKMDQVDQEFKEGFVQLNNTMSKIGTAIQQSVGILSRLVNQGMSNREVISQPHVVPQHYFP